jgi:hypothetical protein
VQVVLSDYIDLTLLMTLYLTFTVFLLKILCSLWCDGKCLSIRLRKLRPILVLRSVPSVNRVAIYGLPEGLAGTFRARPLEIL